MIDYEIEINKFKKKILRLAKIHKAIPIGFLRKYLEKKIGLLVEQRDNLFREWREFERAKNPDNFIRSSK